MKQYSLFVILLLIFTIPTSAGIIIDEPSYDEINVWKEDSFFVKYTIRGDETAPEVEDGEYAVRVKLFSGNCPLGTQERSTRDIRGTWVAGEEIKLDIVEEIDLWINIDSQIVDAEKIQSDSRGTFLCFTMDVYFLSNQGTNFDTSKEIIVRIYDNPIATIGPIDNVVDNIEDNVQNPTKGSNLFWTFGIGITIIVLIILWVRRRGKKPKGKRKR